MPASVPEADRPYVPTSIARHLQSRLQVTHDERGIAVISGPWGIGKTTAINAFAAEHCHDCVVVKVEQTTKKGASAVATMQYTLEAMRPMLGKTERSILSNSYWALRQRVHRYLTGYFGEQTAEPPFPSFTFIFDEAQYLSREAIEMLRYWNDTDRTTTPFPVGLFFVGNEEFSLEEDASGHSVISGAVRSRALFIESLEYDFVSDTDLTLFAQSRGITDPGAITALVKYYSGRKVKRDLRNVERLIATIRRRASSGPITAATVNSILDPA